MTPIEEIKTLREELHGHNFNYYALSAPTITDAEYDQKLRHLRELENHWPEMADPNSPTTRVGSAPVKGFEKVKHKVKMLSLDNAFDAEEVAHFLINRGTPSGSDLVLEPKVDGLSLDLQYKNGCLVRATTRGDGSVGDDVTANARTIASIPLVLREGVVFSGHVRGEVYMEKAVFARLNEELSAAGEDLFANPRNAASGTMKSKDSATVAARKLSFIAYDFHPDADSIAYETHIGQLFALSSWGFVSFTSSTVSTAINLSHDEVEDALQGFAEIRSQLPYEIDGVVVKVNNIALRRDIGEGTKFPNWAVAYKFPAERAVTRLRSVTCQIGKTGAVTPVAELAPVLLAGTTVSRASLMSSDEIARIGGLSLGDLVVVLKSGEIIPRVVAVHERSYRDCVGNAVLLSESNSPSECPSTIQALEPTVRDALAEARGWTTALYEMPATCPCCNSPLVRVTNNNGEESTALFCTNKLGCTEQIVQRLKHALSKSALDWDGMGDAQVRDLVAAGVRKLSDIFALTDELIDKTLKTAAAKKFRKEREKVKSSPMWRKLNALGIEGIGVTLSKELEIKYPDIAAIVEDTDESLSSLIGTVNTRTFREYMVVNIDEIIALNELGLCFESKRVTGPLTGKTFVITGELQSGARDVVATKIEQKGGVVKGSVSKKVDFLVVGENAGNTKSAKAVKEGVLCINEEELYKMMGEPMPDPILDADLPEAFHV